MSSAPTDRPPRALLLAAAAAALVLLPGAPAARADGPEGDRPVFFRDPDKATALAIHEAISLFGSPSPSDRERARDRLFEIGYWAVPKLLDAVRDKKAQFRSNALLALGRLGDRRCLPPVREAVREDVSEWPPAVAALVLGRLRDAEEPSMAVLRWALASSENPKRKTAACLALAKLHRRRGEECWPLLEQVLDARTPNPSVHFAAMLALGFFRGRVAEPLPDGSDFRPSRPVRDALGDPRAGMRLSAVLAMSVSYNNSFHRTFLDVYRNDPDEDVKRAALLGLARNPDADTTALLVDALESVKSDGKDRRTAAHLLSLRADALKGDARSLDALTRTVTAPRAPEVAALALVALGGVDDDRVVKLVAAKLGDRNATVRAAAAVAATRLRRSEDLGTAQDALQRRIEAGESDGAAKADMVLAVEEIGRILGDRRDVAKGIEPKPRPPVAWQEAGSEDLFFVLGRDHRQRVLDAVNLRVLQVLEVAGLYPYRPYAAPSFKIPDLGGTGADKDARPRRDVVMLDQYDVRFELDRRPYFGPEDDPDATPAPVPREPK